MDLHMDEPPKDGEVPADLRDYFDLDGASSHTVRTVLLPFSLDDFIKYITGRRTIGFQLFSWVHVMYSGSMSPNIVSSISLHHRPREVLPWSVKLWSQEIPLHQLHLGRNHVYIVCLLHPKTMKMTLSSVSALHTLLYNVDPYIIWIDSIADSFARSPSNMEKFNTHHISSVYYETQQVKCYSIS